eukprot:51460-Chlamydomonas_euryale.AAC.1
MLLRCRRCGGCCALLHPVEVLLQLGGAAVPRAAEVRRGAHAKRVVRQPPPIDLIVAAAVAGFGVVADLHACVQSISRYGRVSVDALGGVGVEAWAEGVGLCRAWGGMGGRGWMQ